MDEMKPEKGEGEPPKATGPSDELWSKKSRPAEEIGRGGMASIVRGTDVTLAASGIHRQAIQQHIVPATIREWLLILPYVLLVPVLLLRDSVQLAGLRRRLRAGA